MGGAEEEERGQTGPSRGQYAKQELKTRDKKMPLHSLMEF